MSVQAITLALSASGVGPSEKLLLLVLANYADEEMKCWPSMRRLAADTAMSERTIQRSFKTLEACGIVERKQRNRADGSRASDIIVLCFQRNDNLSPPPVKLTPPPVTVSPPPVTLSPGGDTVSPLTTFEPSRTRQSEAKASVARKRTPIPEDWEPRVAEIEFAAKHGLGPEALERETAKFKAHHTAAGKTMANWSAAWRTWVLNAEEWRKARTPEPVRKVTGALV